MSGLKSERVGPPVGRAKRMVVLLHGYGADGRDLIPLAEPLAGELPETLFVAPDAHRPCSVNAMGREWFPIPWIDGSAESDARAVANAAFGVLDEWLDQVLEAEGLAAADTAILGFSQGAMMGLHVAPRRRRPVAALVGISGRLLVHGDDADPVLSRPPVLLVHGDADPVVPYDCMGEAERLLADDGFDVRTHTSPATGHGIAPDGLATAAEFLGSHLLARG